MGGPQVAPARTLAPAVAGDLAWLPGWRLAELIRSKELSPVELIAHVLQRIEQVEPAVNSFITVAAEQALDRARAAEQAVAHGDRLGALHGVPVSIKDNIWTAGIRTTFGSLLFRDFVPTADSVVTERLLDAGAIIVGKSNMPEFPGGGGGIRSINRLVPECLNPWDPGRIAGASSGGAAAGLAAGLVPVAIGTDDGGSIRLPSALCGVYGLFPTPGRVPSFGSFVSSATSAIGPMTRDVRDAALVLQVVAGFDVRDPESRRDQPADYQTALDAGVRGMRLAWSSDYGHIESPSPAVVDAIKAGAMVFADLGATVTELAVRFADVWGVGGIPRRDALKRPAVPRLRDLPELVEASRDPLKRALLCPYIDIDRLLTPPQPNESVAGGKARRTLVKQLNSVFSEYDLLLAPTINQVAPLIPEGWEFPSYGVTSSPGSESTRVHATRAYVSYTQLVNVAQCVAASIPCGFVDGMPVGLQVIGPAGTEAKVLMASRAFEEARPWAHARPPQFS